MSTYQQTESSFNILKNKLNELLVEYEPKFSLRREGGYPLLVLETLNDSAGFTIVGDTPEEPYKNAYSSFKLLYKDNHESWRKKTLSFIVFSKDDIKNHEHFFSNIQSDVYFCRKYIGHFKPDGKKLEKELRHLPFLPLDESNSKDLERPISAQNLIQSLGVSSKLSRSIVVSGQKSAKRIVEDLWNEKSKLPEIDRKSVSTIKKYRDPINRTRVKRLVVEGFRGYNQLQEFDLDADIIVLYGPNGLGKTSFFDAIDYVSTGRIGRLRKNYKNKHDDFEKIAQNLSASSPGYVSLEITQNNSIHTIKRSIDDWSNASFDGEVLNRTEILQKLTLARWEGKKERIEILEKLFRATHLFSQSNAELLTDFEDDSKLSSDIVSRALALEDYTSSQSKLSDVILLINKKIKAHKNKLSETKLKIKELQTKIDDLPGPKGQDTDLKIQRLSADLKNNIKNLDILNVRESEEVTKDSVKEWRSIIAAKLKISQEKINNLKNLSEDIRSYKDDKSEYKEKLFLKRSKDHDLGVLTHSIHEIDVKIENLSDEINNRNDLIDSFNTKLKSLDKIKDLTRKEVEIQRESKLKFEKLKELKTKISDIDNKFHSLSDELDIIINEKSVLGDDLDKLNSKHRLLENLKLNHEVWESSKIKIDALQIRINNLKSELVTLKDKIDKKKTSILELEEKKFRESHKIENLTINNDKLTELLDEIENFIDDSKCPACGYNHLSKESLLKKLRSQKENRPKNLNLLIENTNTLKKEIADLKDDLDLLKHSEEQIQARLKENTDIYGELVEYVNKYQSILNAVNISIDNDNMIEIINNELLNCSKMIDSLSSKITNIKDKEKEVLNLRKGLLERKEIMDNDREAMLLQFNSLKTKIDQVSIEIEKESKKLPGNLNKEKIKFSVSDFREQKRNAQEEIVNLLERKSNLVSQKSELEKERQDIKQKAKEISDQVEILKYKILDYESRYFKLLEEGEVKEEDLDNKIFTEKKFVSKLQKHVNQALLVERALDSAELTAMVAELKSKLNLNLSNEEDILFDLNHLDRILKWIRKLDKLIQEQNFSAVEQHVEILGPLSSIIQKRLRTVYGFGDISLIPDDDEIRVEVDWNGTKKKPTDYFSDSQKQILMLSLFVSGRLTQAWSGFSPILLDDPVTHFDDLNAYGFIELIRGLVSTAPGKRQFIISTCEERLFELMKKKFNQVDGGAKFYRFENITDKGPVITKLA